MNVCFLTGRLVRRDRRRRSQYEETKVLTYRTRSAKYVGNTFQNHFSQNRLNTFSRQFCSVCSVASTVGLKTFLKRHLLHKFTFYLLTCSLTSLWLLNFHKLFNWPSSCSAVVLIRTNGDLGGFCYSSVSSSLSGSAANCWDDILKVKLSSMTEQRKALTNRLLGAFMYNCSWVYLVIMLMREPEGV